MENTLYLCKKMNERFFEISSTFLTPFGAGLVKKIFFKNIRNNLYNKHVVKTFRQCIYNENHLYFIFYYMFDNCNDYEIVSLYFVAIQAFTRTQAIVSTYSKQFKVNSDTKCEILFGLFKSRHISSG